MVSFGGSGEPNAALIFDLCHYLDYVNMSGVYERNRPIGKAVAWPIRVVKHLLKEVWAYLPPELLS